MNRPKALCVDDEPQVLQGLKLSLRGTFEVVTANGGAMALELLGAAPSEFAVVCSDMRMPHMDGATLLKAAAELAPDATRLLLTGQADLDSAVAAINEGKIFRFLTKPCGGGQLQDAFAAALRQHQLVRAERDLLQLTVRGAVKAVTELLALADPELFGRGERIRTLALGLAGILGVNETWPLEVAALLAHAGAVTLPKELTRKLALGTPLSTDEQRLVARLPLIAEGLVAEIPRLEVVREIMLGARVRLDADAGAPLDASALAGRILRVAIDYEHLQSQRVEPAVAIASLGTRGGIYDPTVLAALEQVAATRAADNVEEVPLADVAPGMTLAEDLYTTGGLLVASRGYPITARFIERVRNAAPGSFREVVRVRR